MRGGGGGFYEIQKMGLNHYLISLLQFYIRAVKLEEQYYFFCSNYV